MFGDHHNIVKYTILLHVVVYGCLSVKVNRMFGAKKFQFYVRSSTAELEACLDEYQKLGIVDVQRWAMPQQLLRDEVGFVIFNILT